jgi:hypothetical protein
MAEVTQRVWRSGPRKVKRVAYGYTFQDADGRQVRKSDASWSREDAEKALAARLLNLTPDNGRGVAPGSVVTFKAMTERYLKEKEISRKRTLQQDKDTITRLLAFFGESTPLTAITAPRIAEYRILRSTTGADRCNYPSELAPRTWRLLVPGEVLGLFAFFVARRIPDTRSASGNTP